MTARVRTDVLLLVAFCGFLFFYGLGSFGLVGADEPRYAQIAREMLARHDWVTPTLQGKPWLEKPVLYYWEAMAAYSLAGVSDRAARLPSAFDAALLIAAVYLFLRRFRPGSEIDGALITAACAAILGFARAASTDMPLSAMFAIAMLAWFAWYEDRRPALLAVFFAFLALAVLAKGPVALFFAVVIVLIFAVAKHDWLVLLRTLWIPGIVLFLAAALPWYVAVQARNPQFLRVFILEHNLGRFSHNLYHHQQPFWFYLPVLLFGSLPWALWLALAVLEKLRLLWLERGGAFTSAEDSLGLFLLIWLLVPALFFSFSQSKLPGYILPALPAAALLVSEHVAARAQEGNRVSVLLALLHGVVCGGSVFAAFLVASFVPTGHFARGTGVYIAAAVAFVVVLVIAAALLRSGLRMLRFATMIPVVLTVGALVRLASPAIDARFSARPIAQTIQDFSLEPVPVAVFHTNREQEFGLEFYLDRPMQHYDWNQVPAEGHVLVAARNSESAFARYAAGRKVSYLSAIPAQKLDLYWVAALQPETLKP